MSFPSYFRYKNTNLLYKLVFVLGIPIQLRFINGDRKPLSIGLLIKMNLWMNSEIEIIFID